MWVWLKIQELGLRRFWSMFPLTRATHFGTGFLSHTHVVVTTTISLGAAKRGLIPKHRFLSK